MREQCLAFPDVVARADRAVELERPANLRIDPGSQSRVSKRGRGVGPLGSHTVERNPGWCHRRAMDYRRGRVVLPYAGLRPPDQIDLIEGAIQLLEGLLPRSAGL